MFCEDQLLPLAALQHLSFCERQCALMYVELLWSENRLTAEGALLHERVHAGGDETRTDLRLVRALRVRSLRLGLYGVADVVEFHRVDGPGISLAGQPGHWRPAPVEYKRGRPKPDNCDRVQLCAQAMCLEEMLAVPIAAGSIYYGQPRRREEVQFVPSLRSEVERASARLHDLIASGRTPPPIPGKQCESCSLSASCLPTALAGARSGRAFLDALCESSSSL